MVRVRSTSWWWAFLGVLLLLPPAPAVSGDEFPSNEVLESRNVALRFRKLVFSSGMRQTPDGKPSCNGLEILESASAGSGFIVKEDGTIVTNWHVATKAIYGEAEFADGSKYEIRNIKAGSGELDIAILKIGSQRKFAPVALGDSDKIRSRDRVLAVGNTLGMGLNITEGQVSQVVKDDEGRTIVLRHTAQIAPGNSGGALFKGNQVVGVNVSVNLALGAPSGFNNAIPINLVRAYINDPRLDRLLPLKDVFNPSLEYLTKILVPVLTTNGQVAGATKDRLGMAVEVLQTGSLEDYLVVVESPGRDLGILAVVAGGKKLLGCGDMPAVGAEALLFSSDYPQEVGIVVVNKEGTPAKYGLFVGKIKW